MVISSSAEETPKFRLLPNGKLRTPENMRAAFAEHQELRIGRDTPKRRGRHGRRRRGRDRPWDWRHPDDCCRRPPEEVVKYEEAKKRFYDHAYALKWRKY